MDMVIAGSDPIIDDSLRALLQYWAGKRRSNALPARKAIDPVEIPRLLKHVFLIEVIDGGATFRFRVAGHLVCNLWGTEVTRLTLADICDPLVHDAMCRQFAEPVEVGEACYHRNAYCGPAGKTVRYETLLLPLWNDGRSVETLLGGTALLPAEQDDDIGEAMLPNTLVDLL